MIRPQPWRADVYQAVIYTPAEPLPMWYTGVSVALFLLLIAALVYCGVVLIGGSIPHDCDCDGVCLVARAERGRHRRGL